MKNLIKVSVLIFVNIFVVFGGWGQKPDNWEDFEMGVLSGSTVPDSLLTIFIDSIVPDRRYFWVTDVNSPGLFMFTSFANYSKKEPFYSKGVKPSIVISMLQNGGDGISDIRTQAADSAFMVSYFEALVHIADSSEGTKPIYIIEPDVWGYILNSDNANLGSVELERTCHINNLGFAWLSEFENKLKDLPNAIIKTLKQADPNCFAGIEMPYWAYHPAGMNGNLIPLSDSSYVKQGADSTIAFLNNLLGASNRGDFIAVGKQEGASGYYEAVLSNTDYSWDSTANRKWLYWSKLLGENVDLPLYAYKISAGYINEPGYPALANIKNKYEDGFLQYFFNNSDDFIRAGFIGLLAGTAAAGNGTYIEWGQGGAGDNGYFYDNLKLFNDDKPYLQKISKTTGIICTDLNGNNYNIDSLLNNGKHILVYQVFVSSPVGTHNGPFLDDVYELFGDNKEDLIVLVADVLPTDDSSDIVDAFISKGAVPNFPIILANNGGTSLGNLFPPLSSNNKAFFHPNRDFDDIFSMNLTDAQLIAHIENAITDDCVLADVSNFNSSNSSINIIDFSWELPEGDIGKIHLLIDTLPNISLSDSNSVLKYIDNLAINSINYSFSVPTRKTNYYAKLFLENTYGIFNAGVGIFTEPYILNQNLNLLKVHTWDLEVPDGGDDIDTTGGLFQGDTLSVSFTFDNDDPNIGLIKTDTIFFGSSAQSLKYSKFLKVTYKSDTTVALILHSNIISDLYEYQYLLPTTNGMWITDSILLDTLNFKQPSETPVGNEESLLLSSIYNVSFRVAGNSNTYNFNLCYFEIDKFSTSFENVSEFAASQQSKGGDSVNVKLDWQPSSSILGDSLLIQWTMDPAATINSSNILDSLYVQRNITSRTIKVANIDSSYYFLISLRKGVTGFATALLDTVNIANSIPTDITLSSSTVSEGVANEVVGILSTVDQDSADLGEHAYEITVGDSDFILKGNDTLITSKALVAGFIGVKIKTTDIFGSSFIDSFTIEVQDTTTPRYHLTVEDASGSSTNLKMENEIVPIIASKKADSANIEYSFLVWTEDTSYVESVNSESTTVTMPAESVVVIAKYQIFNYKPTDINISSSSIGGDVDSGTFVAILNTVDQDLIDTFTYVLNEGNEYFLVSNDSVFTFSNFDSTHYGTDITIKVTSTDLKGSSIQDSFNIRINDPNGPSAFLTVNNGNDSTTNKYTVGDEVDIVAYDEFIDKVFKSWTGSVEAIITGGNLSKEISVKIPDTNITLTALYDTTYLLSVTNGSGTGRYVEGSQVEISAIDSLPFGRAFNKWIGDTATLDSSLKSTATVIMPASNVEVVATYKDDTDPQYQLTVNSGSGSGSYKQDTTITITAIDSSSYNRLFDKWIGDIEHVDSSLNATAIVTMPNSNIEVTATYRDAGVTTYQLVVNGGNGSGNYIADTSIQIIAFDSTSSGRIFDKWEGDTEYLSDSLNDSAIVTMPALDISVTALYKDIHIDSTLLDIILADSVINATDFVHISKHWNYSANNHKDSLLELSPYSGELPNISVIGDSLFDYKDLSAFAALSYHFPENRNYKNVNRQTSRVTTTVTSIKDHYNVEFNVNSVSDFVSCGIKIKGDKGIEILGLNTDGILSHNGQVFKVIDTINNAIVIYLTRLSAEELSVSGSGKLLSLDIISSSKKLSLEYELINSDSKIIESGKHRELLNNKTLKLTVAPNPSIPDNQQIHFTFDKMIYSSGGFNFILRNIGETYLPSSIHIEILDNSGNSLVSSKKTMNSDYCTFYWNGCNNNNRPVATGTYKLIISYDNGADKEVITEILGIKK